MKGLSLILAIACGSLAVGQDHFSWSGNDKAYEWTAADVPPQFKRYKSAKYTQRIAVTNGRDTILPIRRASLLEKWRVPGGLEGVKGWKSDLYSWADGEAWVGNISVLNSLGYFQSNRGWKRSYSDGSEFLDVLTNTGTGKVFEVRKAVKKDGQWQRFTTYRDAAQRPKGYAGPPKDCRSCHSEAGTGGYAEGLVPGGDTVISHPFEALEDGPPESGASLFHGRGTAITATPLSGRSRSAASC